MKESYVSKTYFGLASDPVHIGTGGYTLGRVDNPIVRDFDGIPKIPGTSIEGTARTFAYFKGLARKNVHWVRKTHVENAKYVFLLGLQAMKEAYMEWHNLVMQEYYSSQ